MALGKGIAFNLGRWEVSDIHVFDTHPRGRGSNVTCNYEKNEFVQGLGSGEIYLAGVDRFSRVFFFLKQNHGKYDQASSLGILLIILEDVTFFNSK